MIEGVYGALIGGVAGFFFFLYLSRKKQGRTLFLLADKRMFCVGIQEILSKELGLEVRVDNYTEYGIEGARVRIVTDIPSMFLPFNVWAKWYRFGDLRKQVLEWGRETIHRHPGVLMARSVSEIQDEAPGGDVSSVDAIASAKEAACPVVP